VNDSRRLWWCGPTALSAVTGLPMSRFMPKRRGAMTPDEINRALLRAGLTAHIMFLDPPRMLWRALTPNGRGIVWSRTHCWAFLGLLVLDTRRRTPTWVHDHPDARSRVRGVIWVHEANHSTRRGM